MPSPEFLAAVEAHHRANGIDPAAASRVPNLKGIAFAVWLYDHPGEMERLLDEYLAARQAA